MLKHSNLPDPATLDQINADEAARRAELRDMQDLAAQIAAEVTFLQTTIPTIDAMTAAQVRGVAKRLAQENLAILKGLRYLIRNA